MQVNTTISKMTKNHRFFVIFLTDRDLGICLFYQNLSNPPNVIPNASKIAKARITSRSTGAT